MEEYRVPRNTLRDFLGICELKIVDQNKYDAITKTAKDSKGKPAVKTIEKYCRAALSDYKAQINNLKSEGKLLPFFPSEDFYGGQ